MTILNDILDFSKIEAGKLELETTEFDIISYTKDLLRSFKYTAENKGISFEVVAEDYPSCIFADEGRVGQVLTNLVGNAIKFTKSGGVRVELGVSSGVSGPADFSLVKIFVHDTGIGIPANAKARMFQAFSQAEPITHRNFGGTGLGLSISKRLVDLMGGTIGFVGNDKGTTFYVELKLKTGKKIEKQLLVENHNLNQSHSHKILGRILVAEDNSTNQMVITRMLDKWGCKYQVVANGNEVLDAMRDGKFDLILMDCQMPEMDGYQATRHIRGQKSLKHDIPIVALTANAVQGDQQKCRDAGMNDYLSKPIDREKLKFVLLKYLVAEEDGRVSVMIERDSLAQLEDLGDEGKDSVVEFIDSFVLSAQKRIEALNKCIQKGDVIGAAREAHSLKSSAQTLGAKKLGAVCQEIEVLKDSQDITKISLLFDKLFEVYTNSCSELIEIKNQRVEAAARRVA